MASGFVSVDFIVGCGLFEYEFFTEMALPIIDLNVQLPSIVISTFPIIFIGVAELDIFMSRFFNVTGGSFVAESRLTIFSVVVPVITYPKSLVLYCTPP